MKHNKFYKFLRIVFLTLAIISMVFALFRKISHAASGDTGEFIYTKYPLPVGADWGYGGQLTGEIVSDMIEEALALYPDMKLLTVPMVWDSNEMSVNVYRTFSGINFSGDINDLDNPSSITYSGTGVGLSYRVNLGGYTGLEYTMGTGACVPSNYVTQGPSQGDVYLLDSVYIPQYPLYISSDVDPSVYNQYFFFVGGSGDDTGGGITISGHSVGSGSLDFDGFTYDLNGNLTGITGGIDLDLNVDLDTSGIEEKLNDLIDGQTEISSEIIYQGNSLGGKIDGLATAQGQTNSKLEDIKGKLEDIKGKLDTARGKISDILDKIEEFFEWVTNPFDQEEFDADVDDLPLFDLVDSVKGNMQTNLASFNNTSVTDPIFVFDISGPIMGEDQTFTLDLTSYEDYKNLIVPLITMILTVTFVFSLFNDLPNLFHGKSGQDNVN